MGGRAGGGGYRDIYTVISEAFLFFQTEELS
jgi:hypothetical protein